MRYNIKPRLNEEETANKYAERVLRTYNGASREWEWDCSLFIRNITIEMDGRKMTSTYLVKVNDNTKEEDCISLKYDYTAMEFLDYVASIVDFYELYKSNDYDSSFFSTEKVIYVNHNAEVEWFQSLNDDTRKQIKAEWEE